MTQEPEAGAPGAAGGAAEALNEPATNRAISMDILERHGRLRVRWAPRRLVMRPPHFGPNLLHPSAASSSATVEPSGGAVVVMKTG